MRNIRNRSIVLLVLVVAVLTGMAAPVDRVAAHGVASRFASQGHLRSSGWTLRLAHVEKSASDVARADYYVFQAGEGGGFIIVAGDDRARQVLAYGDSPIDVDHVPHNVQWLLDQYKEQIEYLHNHPQAQPSSTPVLNVTGTVPQLMTTQWGQRSPYRDQCPQVNGQPCVTGCVATAMAQVMNYWEYPSVLPDLPAYKTDALKLEVPALPSVPIDWNLMLDRYREGSYTQEQGAEVAKLMRYCGQSCEMDYSIASSGAFTIDQLRGLQLFGYNPWATYVQRYCYTDEEWHAMLLDDLFAGHPVAYSGIGTYSSHSFVIDGYDGSKYHVNWGWDGLYDGYFELDAMNGGGFKPNRAHSMLHGVCPVDEAVDDVFVVDGIYYRINGLNLVEVTYKDTKYNTYKGDIIVPDTVYYAGKPYIVRAIGESAFRRCSRLTSVSIPGTVVRIGPYAFSYSGITGVELPDDVVMIRESAFSRCSSLSSVKLGNSITELADAVFGYCESLTGIVLPQSLKRIGLRTFRYSGLKNVVIPDSVTGIGKLAFENCAALTSVTIGASVEEIGLTAFKGCESIDSVISLATVPPVLMDESCFPDVTYAHAALLVPQGSLADYRTAQHWERFMRIEPLDAVLPVGDVNGDMEVNIADINAVIGAILSGEDNDPALDVSGDGAVDIADVNCIINIILGLG